MGFRDLTEKEKELLFDSIQQYTKSISDNNAKNNDYFTSLDMLLALRNNRFKIEEKRKSV